MNATVITQQFLTFSPKRQVQPMAAAKEVDVKLGLMNSSARAVNIPGPARLGEPSGTTVVRNSQILLLRYKY